MFTKKGNFSLVDNPRFIFVICQKLNNPGFHFLLFFHPVKQVGLLNDALTWQGLIKPSFFVTSCCTFMAAVAVNAPMSRYSIKKKNHRLRKPFLLHRPAAWAMESSPVIALSLSFHSCVQHTYRLINALFQ